MSRPLAHPTDPDHYLVSPRHAYFFETNESVRRKIQRRVTALHSTGCLSDKQLIINVQDGPTITELHDGNASAVAWSLYALSTGVPRTFEALTRAFGSVVVLRNRRHPTGELWHPYVPAELVNSPALQSVHDPEQERDTCLALNRNGEPVYFDNTQYFAGVDRAVPLGEVAQLLLQTQ